MEIKLTADWILQELPTSMHKEKEGWGAVTVYIDHHDLINVSLIKLTLDDIGVEYEMQEWLDEENEEQSFISFVFELEGVKNACPEVYKTIKELPDCSLNKEPDPELVKEAERVVTSGNLERKWVPIMFKDQEFFITADYYKVDGKNTVANIEISWKCEHGTYHLYGAVLKSKGGVAFYPFPTEDQKPTPYEEVELLLFAEVIAKFDDYYANLL